MGDQGALAHRPRERQRGKLSGGVATVDDAPQAPPPTSEPPMNATRPAHAVPERAPDMRGRLGTTCRERHPRGLPLRHWS